MKLSDFEVHNYKIIDDTKPVKVDERVTALLGKNESGKSSILRSLWKSRNVAGAKFDKLYDYPRDRYSRERKSTQKATVIRFKLDPEEIEEIVSAFPRRPSQNPEIVTLTTCYSGEDGTSSKIEFDAEAFPRADEVLNAIRLVSQTISANDQEAGGPIREAADTASTKIEAQEPIWKSENVAAYETFATAVAGWVASEGARSSVAVTERDTLSKLIAQSKMGNPWDKARDWATKNILHFIYFTEYGQLETRIHLPTYMKRKGTDDVKARTQTALFEWSGLDPAEILDLGRVRQHNESDESVQRRHEKRRALLDSASFSLTGDWLTWWDGSSHKLHFDADAEDLVLKVSDAHNEFPIPFEERSHGFQWFFSFYLVFLVESKRAHKAAVLLLDEPGLHLHPTLQENLIKLFERISDTNQLIYSTHLPFLVDGDHLDRVRTVYLTGSDPKKTVVSNELRPKGDRDTLFPLQAAVGYSIAQTLFLGKRSLVVEGITDYWIIKTLDNCLSQSAGERLHDDTVLIPAGGTSRLMPLASIMLASTGVSDSRLAVLLDSDKEGRDAARRFEEEFQGESTVVMLGAAIGLTDATIEDILPRNVYVDTIKKLGHPVTLNSDEQNASTNVKAIEMAFERLGLGKFGLPEKVAAVLSLIDEWGKDPSAIPAPTVVKARALFAIINSTFATT